MMELRRRKGKIINVNMGGINIDVWIVVVREVANINTIKDAVKYVVDQPYVNMVKIKISVRSAGGLKYVNMEE
tara:strand:- start:110 stop:328 length:219 start_codon:yes stop_codon:yes gene_type:complete